MRLTGLNEWTLTAGPGSRLEVFTQGCARGLTSPCQGCFNASTWTFEGNHQEVSPIDLFESIEMKSWNGLVTFCGGEPILQGRELLEVLRLMEKSDKKYHTLLYTSYQYETLVEKGLIVKLPKTVEQSAHEYLSKISLSQSENGHSIRYVLLTKEEVKELFSMIDMVVDGVYDFTQRLTTSKTMHEQWFVGSANQNIHFTKKSHELGTVIFQSADDYQRRYLNGQSSCPTCMTLSKSEFCSNDCEEFFDESYKIQNPWG